MDEEDQAWDCHLQGKFPSHYMIIPATEPLQFGAISPTVSVWVIKPGTIT